MKKVILGLFMFFGMHAGDVMVPLSNTIQVQEHSVPLTNAQQYVVVQNIADMEHVESGISAKEMVIEKIKDILRVIGRRISMVWYWFLKYIKF